MHAPVSVDELKGFLREDHGFDPQREPNFRKRVYVCPTPEFFFGPYARAVGWLFEKLQLSDYVTEENHCTDFTGGAAWLARALHHRTARQLGLDVKAGIAIGEFCYYRNGIPSDEHSLTIARFADRSVGFLEAQGNPVYKVELKPHEKCTFYEF